MGNLTFSIIIPIYNVERYLEKCVRSVTTQSFTDIEILLINDGSSDSCPDICESLAKSDDRIIVVNKTNGGLSDARNIGLSKAKGEYVIFLDSDDYYLNSDFIYALYNKLADSKCDLLFFKRRKLYESTNNLEPEVATYSNSISEEKEFGKLIYHLSANDELDASAAMKVIRRKILIENNIYFRKGITAEDIEWFYRLIRHINSASVINDIAYCYRIRKDSISHSISLKSIQDLFLTIEINAQSLHDIKYKTDYHLGLLNYLCYQYNITIGLIGCYLKGKDYNEMLSQCKKYNWLCSYAISPKTRKSSFLIRFLGLKISSFLLGKYIAHKKS